MSSGVALGDEATTFILVFIAVGWETRQPMTQRFALEYVCNSPMCGCSRILCDLTQSGER